MTLDTLIIFSGAFVAILPFLGLPNSWDSILFSIAGVLVVSLGIVVRRRGKHGAMARAIGNPNFVENIPAEGMPQVQADRVVHERE